MDFTLQLSDAEVALAQMLMQRGAEALLQNIAAQCQEQASKVEPAQPTPTEAKP